VAVRKGVGVILGLLIVAVLISVLGMAAIFFAARGGPDIRDNATLYLQVDGSLSEVESGGVVGQFIGTEPTLRSTIDSLRKAAVDTRIKSVVIVPRGGGALWGQVQELREAVLEFRKSGKPIVAYLEYGAEHEYYLASACDKVYLMPASSLDLRGLATYELFFRGALDKIGVYPDLLHIGDYKTAANTFTEKGFTPAHREMAESLNHDLYAQLLRGIADGRGKTEEDVRALLDHGPYLPRDAVAAGLVDDLAYEDELDDKVDLGGAKQRIDGEKYAEVSPVSLGLDKGPKIAVLYIVGVIASGASSFDSPGGAVTGSDTVVEWLRKVRADNAVRAIVLRIDSPGGSAIASDIIWREVTLTRNIKPVVASMGNVAASGGYYVAMPANAVIAQPGTLTGSIGVVVGKYALGGTMEKLGVGVDGVESGKYAGMLSPVRPFSPEERARVMEQMQATYDTFVEKVADARASTPEKIDAIAQGRVWTGRQARELGLVDDLGGLWKAIAVAKQRAKIDPGRQVQLDVYPPRRSLYELVASPFGSMAMARAAGPLGALFLHPRVAALREDPRAKALESLATRLNLFRSGEPLALMPNVFVK
ncbi:MAG: signal peptide peptidase SppA, partial [Acidobacteriota bacterium]|nr:signal peptide peptidase SppA [Acidobacteriota bacterium]